MKFLVLALSPLFAFCDVNLHEIGLKVWKNECRCTLDGLVTWNIGEEFPSLGLGHFIWYPENTPKKFEETFPSFIAFLKERDPELEIPSWLSSKKGFPWKTREAFEKDKREKKIQALRDLLSKTLDHQIAFLFSRFENAEKELLPHLNEIEKKHLAQLKKSSEGMYALIDYINFKGLGLSLGERYHGQGWGLLQVLQNIPDKSKEGELVQTFVQSAKKTLIKRIQNSPPARNEQRWKNGWFKRVESYIEPPSPKGERFLLQHYA